MKSNGRKATKPPSNNRSKPKASKKQVKVTSSKRATKAVASKNGEKRQVTRSTVPARFRELKRMDPKAPGYWELRDQFKAYYKSLPEDEIETFLAGVKRPFPDYLAIDLAHDQYQQSGT